MSNVFKGQKLLVIRLDCLTSLENAGNPKILYRKPDNSTGNWTAQKDGDTTCIMVNCEDGKIDQAGIWEFQSYFEEEGKPIFGNIVQQKIEEPITNKIN